MIQNIQFLVSPLPLNLDLTQEERLIINNVFFYIWERFTDKIRHGVWSFSLRIHFWSILLTIFYWPQLSSSWSYRLLISNVKPRTAFTQWINSVIYLSFNIVYTQILIIQPEKSAKFDIRRTISNSYNSIRRKTNDYWISFRDDTINGY